MKGNKKAFTLIELLVVVLIIGILAAIALPQYEKAVLKAKLTRIDIFMNALCTSIDTYILANGIPSSGISLDMSQLDVGIPFDSYNPGEHSYYNKYGQWKLSISSASSYIYFFGRNSMAQINIGIDRPHSSKKWRLNNVPSELSKRKVVCQWWATKHDASTIINGGNPSYPAKTWCAEVGVQ